MKSLNLVNTVAEYNELKSNYDSIDPYICYIQDEKLTMYDGVPSTWLIRYTSSDGNVVNPSTNKFGNVNIVDNIYRDGEGIIVFDGSVTSIESYAFMGCSSLTSISIGNSVTSIGDEAFKNCKSLTSVTINVTTPPGEIGENVFGNTNSNLIIYVPDESVDTYKTAPYWSLYADQIKPISLKPA